jgi:hypothetical protein
MTLFTDETIRRLLASSLKTATIDQTGWHDAREGPEQPVEKNVNIVTKRRLPIGGEDCRPQLNMEISPPSSWGRPAQGESAKPWGSCGCSGASQRSWGQKLFASPFARLGYCRPLLWRTVTSRPVTQGCADLPWATCSRPLRWLSYGVFFISLLGARAVGLGLTFNLNTRAALS